MAEKTDAEKVKAAKAAQAAKKAGLEKQASSKAGPAFELNQDGRETAHPVPRLKAYYRETVIPAFMEKHELKNLHEVPNLSKIVINVDDGSVSFGPRLAQDTFDFVTLDDAGAARGVALAVDAGRAVVAWVTADGDLRVATPDPL